MGQLLPVSTIDSKNPGVGSPLTQRTRFVILVCLSATLFVSLFYSVSQYFSVPWLLNLPKGSPFFRPSGRPHLPPPPFHIDFIRERIKFSERQYQDLIKERPQVIRAASVVNNTEAKLWDLFPAPFQCPHHVQRLGRLTESPKWLCGLERVVHMKKCIVYSIESNSSSHKSLLTRAPNCETYTLNTAESNQTLFDFMVQNNHTFIDIINMETENLDLLEAFFGEYDFDRLASPPDPYPPPPNVPPRPIELAPVLPIGQLASVFKSGHTEHDNLPTFLKWWEKLEKFGLRPFWISPRDESVQYSFFNIRGDPLLISAHPRRPRHGKPPRNGKKPHYGHGSLEHGHPPPPPFGHRPPLEHIPHHPHSGKEPVPPPQPPHSGDRIERSWSLFEEEGSGIEDSEGFAFE
ncbi:hypothetical protein Moror_17142 [Moniliophthora roreri MCA 2997]|nr:hypothetical protein Moror_17142 [Moniliophthora roreri MCA 2997]KAI3602808.1 hypothetical protein WG66_008109 [Moniliophthora roreri]